MVVAARVHGRVRHAPSVLLTIPACRPLAMVGERATDGFGLVEVGGRGPHGGFWRNRIVPVEAVPAMIERTGRAGDLYSGAFLFDTGISRHIAERGGSVSGYQGPCHAHYLPFDVDCEEPARALDAARQICRFVVGSWGAPEESLPIYWSGRRGIHLGVDSRLFGTVTPSDQLPLLFQELRRWIVRASGVEHHNVIDFGIGDRLRLLRLPNSLHSGSGLYKVPLALSELMEYDVDGIKALAVEPRPVHLTDPTGLLPVNGMRPSAEAAEAYQHCVDRLARRRPYSEQGVSEPSGWLVTPRFLCDAEYRLFHDGVPDGFRSGVALRLASKMRAGGYDEATAAELIRSWNYRNRPPLHETEAQRIVQVAYRAQSPYRYGCGQGNDPPHTRPVYEACGYRDRAQCDHYRLFAASAV